MRRLLHYFIAVLILTTLLFQASVVKALIAPPSDFTVGFAGDGLADETTYAVMRLMKAEGVDMVVIPGDWDHSSLSSSFVNQMNSIFGSNFPIVGSKGNHDTWANVWNFVADRLEKMGVNPVIDNYDNKNYSFIFNNIHFVVLGDGDAGTTTANNYASFVNEQFSNSNSLWRVCVWHRAGVKNFTTDPSGRAMTSVVNKPNEMGSAVYEACRNAGAFIIMGHAHNYSRTKTIMKYQDLNPSQGLSGIISDTSIPNNNPQVSLGRNFAIVSSLLGRSGRQFSCDHHNQDTWWSSIYTNNYYLKNGINLAKDCTADSVRGTYGYVYSENVYPVGQIDSYTNGVLIIKFNHGVATQAQAYFKNIDQDIVDEFTISNTISSTIVTPIPTATASVKPTSSPSPTPTAKPTPTTNPYDGGFNSFGTKTITADFNLNGEGSNVDSIAFWESSDSTKSIMFVTSKGSGLVEVWKYPYTLAESKTSLKHSCFNSGTNGIWVDQDIDKLYIATPNSKNICVFNVSSSGITYQTTFTTSPVTYGIEPNLAMLNTSSGKRLYVSNDTKVYIHDPSSGAFLSTFTPTKGLETMWGDDLNDILYIPDEGGRTGVYAYSPTGTAITKNGATKFGDSAIFNSDEEGIIQYTCPADGNSDDGRGIIIISDQITSSTTGNDYEVFDRRSWEYLGKIKLRLPGSSAFVYNTDGIASTQQSTPAYQGGIFAVIQNDTSVAGVSWNKILSDIGINCNTDVTPVPSPTTAPTTTPTPSYMGDVDRNGIVNFEDYKLIQPLYGTSTANADFNSNGIVDLFDINMVISRLYNKVTPSPTSSSSPAPAPIVTPSPSPTPTKSPSPTPTKSPSPTPTVPPITPTPSANPTAPPYNGAGIGPISLSYKQGGLWLTPEEIANIPMDNASWDSLVTWSKKSGDPVGNIYCTSGGACADTQATRAMYAKAIVGMRTNNQAMISELKSNLDRVETAVNDAIDVKGNLDAKWGSRNIGLIATSANIINYRPASLTRALRRVVYDQRFDGSLGATQIKDIGMRYLSNIPSNARWAYLSTAYLLEDWNSVNAIIKAQAKAMGEKQWAGQTNNHIFSLSGSQASDGWKEFQPNGLSDPYAVMPVGINYNDHGIGGLYLADQWRAVPGPQWPPSFTDYIYEGMGSNNTISWAAHHLGYKNVFSLGNYALLRALIFAYSSHDGKSAWPTSGNDIWQNAAIMTWAKDAFPSLPSDLKPEPNAPVPWPLPVSAGGGPGRSMGFMYATHYARLAR